MQTSAAVRQRRDAAGPRGSGGPERKAAAVAIRPAVLADLPALLGLEERCFRWDRLSRRSFHHLLTRGHAFTLVAETGGGVRGYALVLVNGATALARLYSFAVEPEARGAGVGSALLAAAEARAREDGRAVMRLEVRADDAAVVRLYRRAGYVPFERIADYYEDGAAALRMEKALAGGDRPGISDVPYYAQTTEFTCGPAALMMAMRALGGDRPLARSEEIRLWRESTTVYMTSGHGGCDPFGLALAAHERGLRAEVHVAGGGLLFLDSVRSAEKREVMRLVQEDFRAAAAEAGIPAFERGLGSRDLIAAREAGAVPIVLVSSWRLYGAREPHWVVVAGHDERFIYIHDPYVNYEEHRTPSDGANVPVAHGEFDRMARWGSRRVRAAVIVARGTASGPTGTAVHADA
ncbi:MAG: GNAT family N-acetyltransferase/peptidase C39 family protein [Alphaproteobacteria bacterium]